MRRCEPLWDALEELDVPIGFHPTGNTSLKDDAGRRYVGHANFHPIAHAIRNPVELMGAIASLTTGGVMERHPKLRAAFLEGTAGWLPWWLWRLDDQWEKFGPGCEKPLSMLPSEYFRRQCYIALDVDEEPAVHASTIWGPTTLSCRATTRIPTARFRRRSGNFSVCRSMTSSAVRSCGTIARGFTRSRPRPAR